MQYLIAIFALITPAIAQEQNHDFLEKVPEIMRNQCNRAMNADAAYETQLMLALEKANAEIKRLTEKYEIKK